MNVSPLPYTGKHICVALSGGVDSVCLLHFFWKARSSCNITLSAVHVEHGIRGEASVRDMHFCEELCAAWEIPLTVRRINVPTAAQSMGLEETARRMRYAIFGELIQREGVIVATAHHADDLAETILFRLARGTSPSGMGAIHQSAHLIRPFLHVTREEIEAYAQENHLPHVEDETNGDEAFTRNYIRKTVLPAFEKVHAGAKEHLLQFAEDCANTDAFLLSLARENITRRAGEAYVPVSLPDVLFRRACLVLLAEAGAENGYTRSQIEEIAHLRGTFGGKRVPIAGGKRYDVVIREGKYIVFCRDLPIPEGEMPFVPKEGEYAFPMPFTVKEGEEEGALLADLDAFPEGCVLRTRREGDEICPYHAHRKTLKKFLTDRKIPARLGRRLPVIAKGSEIFAVVGVEIADSVKVTEKTVRRGALRLSEKNGG